MAKKIAIEILKTTISCLFYCAVFLGIVHVAMGSYDFGFQIFSNPVYNASATAMKTIRVANEDQEMDVVKHLQESEVVADYRVAYIRLQFSEYKDKIKPGEYQVNGAMPLDDILATLSKTESVEQGEEE